MAKLRPSFLRVGWNVELNVELYNPLCTVPGVYFSSVRVGNIAKYFVPSQVVSK